MKAYPIIRELPPEFLAGVGAICFEWSQVERALQSITYALLWIGPKHGRVAVRSPRATDQVTMIRQLIDLEKLNAKSVDMDQLATALGKLERQRDVIAHGIWLKGDNGEVLLQDLSGTWKPDPKEPKVSKRIKPQGIAFTAEALFGFATLIKQTRLIVEGRLAKELEEQRRALHSKSPRQLAEDRPSDDHKPDMP